MTQRAKRDQTLEKREFLGLNRSGKFGKTLVSILGKRVWHLMIWFLGQNTVDTSFCTCILIKNLKKRKMRKNDDE